MWLVEWLGTWSRSGCLGFDQELPSSSPGTSTLKKFPRPTIYPAMDSPVANSDQSLVESFEEILWETKKKKKFLEENFYTHIYLDQVREEFLSCIKKNKNTYLKV